MTDNPGRDDVGADGKGEVRISNDVLAVIAGIAANEVPGVTGMAGGFVENISGKLGRHDVRRGVKVETRENTVGVALYISVEYGCRIPEAARQLQMKVKEAVENMTDLEVTAVDVHVQEVVFPSGEGSKARRHSDEKARGKRDPRDD